MKMENFDAVLNASSIDADESFKVQIAENFNPGHQVQISPTAAQVEIKKLNERIAKLEQELESYKKLADSLKTENLSLKQENKDVKMSQSSVVG